MKIEDFESITVSVQSNNNLSDIEFATMQGEEATQDAYAFLEGDWTMLLGQRASDISIETGPIGENEYGQPITVTSVEFFPSIRRKGFEEWDYKTS